MPREISQTTRDLISRLAAIRPEKELTDENIISVSTLTRGLGFFYEKIRNTLDYHEEHLWAKNAVLRILRRKYLAIHNGQKIGRALIEEMIRGRYLENNSVPERKVGEVDAIIEKYRRLIVIYLERRPRLESKHVLEMEDWLMRLCSSELEENLLRREEDRLYLIYMYQSLKERVELSPEIRISEHDWSIRLYVSCFRALGETDRDMESFLLWQMHFPEWKNAADAFLADLAQDLTQTEARIAAHLNWPYHKQIDRLTRRRSILIRLLEDMMEEYSGTAAETLENPEELEAALKKYYQKRYLESRLKLQRSSLRSVIFIFATKMGLAIIGEVPYEWWATHNINFLALGLNTFIPPSILLVATASIKMPSEGKNFTALVIDFNKLISPPSGATHLGTLRPIRQKTAAQKISLGILYAANFALTFGVFYWFFKIFSFNVVSAFFFIIFLSIVSFFALRLKRTANELAAVEEKEGYLQAILDFFSFPVVEIGWLLNEGLQSVNLAAFVFDFMIEAPFQKLVEILEEWTRFLRERKQEM